MIGIPDQVYLWLDHPGIVMRGGWDTNPNLKNIHFIKAEALQHLFDSNEREIARLTAERDEARAATKAAYERAATLGVNNGVAAYQLDNGKEEAPCDWFISQAIRALATEAETNALAEMLDAETRACAEVCATQAEEWRISTGGAAEQDVANECHNAILARLDQRKEAGA